MNMFKENYHLMVDLKQDMEYWDNMIPYEREIYLSILIESLKKENKTGMTNSDIDYLRNVDKEALNNG